MAAGAGRKDAVRTWSPSDGYGVARAFGGPCATAMAAAWLPSESNKGVSERLSAWGGKSIRVRRESPSKAPKNGSQMVPGPIAFVGAIGEACGEASRVLFSGPPPGVLVAFFLCCWFCWPCLCVGWGRVLVWFVCLLVLSVLGTVITTRRFDSWGQVRYIKSINQGGTKCTRH